MGAKELKTKNSKFKTATPPKCSCQQQAGIVLIVRKIFFLAATTFLEL
jgi:hypothetical protein